jgi:hypothetical protein
VKIHHATPGLPRTHHEAMAGAGTRPSTSLDAEADTKQTSIRTGRSVQGDADRQVAAGKSGRQNVCQAGGASARSALRPRNRGAPVPRCFMSAQRDMKGR